MSDGDRFTRHSRAARRHQERNDVGNLAGGAFAAGADGYLGCGVLSNRARVHGVDPDACAGDGVCEVLRRDDECRVSHRSGDVAGEERVLAADTDHRPAALRDQEWQYGVRDAEKNHRLRADRHRSLGTQRLHDGPADQPGAAYYEDDVPAQPQLRAPTVTPRAHGTGPLCVGYADCPQGVDEWHRTGCSTADDTMTYVLPPSRRGCRLRQGMPTLPLIGFRAGSP